MHPDSQHVLSGRKKISVVVPSYNHAKYLANTLESVIRQTYTDYEILLIDDASSDQSDEQIRKFITGHPEIPWTYLRHEQNKGGVVTLNELIELASGEFIALINSDDQWMPEKLERQIVYLDQHPEVGAVFTQAVVVDDNDRVLTEAVDFSPNIFIQTNRSRGKWLRRLFFELNCLCHPSILIRKSVYEQIGFYDPRFRQLPDMQMWVRLLKNTEIHIVEAPLVSLRYHTASTSKLTLETTKRNLNELGLLLNEFFDGMPDKVLLEGFGDLFRRSDISTSKELLCEEAFLFFTLDSSAKSLYTNIGLQKLYKLLGDPETHEVLCRLYHFGYEEFHALAGTKFFDTYLIGFTRFEEPELNEAAKRSIWYELLAVNLFYLRTYLKKYPKIFFAFAKTKRWLRGILGSKG